MYSICEIQILSNLKLTKSINLPGAVLARTVLFSLPTDQIQQSNGTDHRQCNDAHFVIFLFLLGWRAVEFRFSGFLRSVRAVCHVVLSQFTMEFLIREFRKQIQKTPTLIWMNGCDPTEKENEKIVLIN